MFDHFIITRFALDIFDKPVTKKWLKNRIPIFERFYLPSLEAQTNQNFKVLILIKKGLNLRLDLPSKYIVIEIEDKWYQEFRVMLSDLATNPYLITTRVDNDDAVADDFVDRIQKEFKEYQNPTVVDLENGLIIRDGKMDLVRYKSNMFLSMISKVDSFATCYSYKHPEMTRHFPTISVKDEGPFWLINRHKHSLSYNYRRINGNLSLDDDILNRFYLGL